MRTSSTRAHHGQHTHIKQAVPPVVAVKPPTEKPAGPGSGFMSSYLKFLQGERDTSPPPAIRGGKKQTWAARTPIKPEEKPPDTNGVPAPNNNPPVPVVPPPPPPVVPLPITRLSQGDPQDDPRYFPLPKERKRRSLDSSDDGFSSDDDFFGRKKPAPPAAPPPKTEEKDKEKERDKEKEKPKEKDKTKEKEKTKEKVKKEKVKTPKAPGEKKKKEKPPKPEKEKKHKEKNKEPKTKKTKEENVPRREQTKRAAKGKAANLSDIGKDDEPEEPPEFQDSDSDPAWTPAANNTEEDHALPVKKKKGRPRKYICQFYAVGCVIEHLKNFKELLKNILLTYLKFISLFLRFFFDLLKGSLLNK